ncbi:exodeoxyribonuclease III [Nakamurella sp. YIM 132087]|uniref:Exodeoxyribonuclease III n=1 Tax=Nakamurella alba TaxID=2665158 RepID=A0A7K1FJJ2_9ACTN|nr:exodeoxyribonuclease III [Nakamurella alba]MTD14268.1 exodeoxyribonuclease III [Nakamurella alba]
MLRVATFNVNGIRAAVRRGFGDWLARTGADVVCLQEVRSPVALVPPEILDGWTFSYHEGDRAGRNGVAVLSRVGPTAVRIGFGSADFDAEGRWIEVDLPGAPATSPGAAATSPGAATPPGATDAPSGITVASLYLPKGDTAGEKYDGKMLFMKQLTAHIRETAAAGRELVVCGDWNIAHTNADIRSWKTNLKSVGFLPEERAWFGELLADGEMVDVLRSVHPEADGPYTWWSWRGKAFDNDAGWRIDHQVATPGLAATAVAARVDRENSYAERISDHAAVVVDYEAPGW